MPQVVLRDVWDRLVVAPQPVPYLCGPWSAPVVQRLARRRALVVRRRAASVPAVDRATSGVLALQVALLQVAPLQVAPLTTRLHRRLVGQLVRAVGPVVDVDRRQEAVGKVRRTCILLGP